MNESMEGTHREDGYNKLLRPLLWGTFDLICSCTGPDYKKTETDTQHISTQLVFATPKRSFNLSSSFFFLNTLDFPLLVNTTSITCSLSVLYGKIRASMQSHFFCILRQDTAHLVSGLVDATCLIPFLLEKNQEEEEKEEGRKEACSPSAMLPGLGNRSAPALVMLRLVPPLVRAVQWHAHV